MSRWQNHKTVVRCAALCHCLNVFVQAVLFKSFKGEDTASPKTPKQWHRLCAEHAKNCSFAGFGVELRFRDMMSPGAKLSVDVEVQSAGGCDCCDDGRERLVTSKRAERLELGILLQLGELVRG